MNINHFRVSSKWNSSSWIVFWAQYFLFWVFLKLFCPGDPHLENCPYTSASHAQLISPFPAKALGSGHVLNTTFTPTLFSQYSPSWWLQVSRDDGLASVLLPGGWRSPGMIVPGDLQGERKKTRFIIASLALILREDNLENPWTKDFLTKYF